MKMFVTHFKRCKNYDHDVMCWQTHDVTVIFYSYTTSSIRCNTVRPQLRSDPLYPAHDVTNIAAQKTVFK